MIKKLIKYVEGRVKRHYIRKYGVEILEKLNEISASTGKPVWLDYGTLLGAYRDHGFIPHDIDMDVAMYAKDFDYAFERALYDRGFKILRKFTMIDAKNPENRRVTEITVKYKRVQTDIFFKFAEEGKTYGILWTDADKDRNICKVYRDFFDYTGFEETDFLGIKVLTPRNTKEFLQAKYGDDFMTPLPNWQPPKKVYLPLEEYYGESFGGWIG
jgi:phosphorylcholine metabolism protein LicD